MSRWTFPLVAIAVLCQGCAALVFYETAKISLTLEARPDSSQPVQGNLGFKQRTAVIAPQMNVDGEHAKDAPAMISAFRFGKSSGFPGTIDIRTALVTGDVDLTEAEAKKVAEALAVPGIPTWDEITTVILRNAREEKTEDDLRSLVATPPKDFTVGQQREFERLTSSPYYEALHEALRERMGVL